MLVLRNASIKLKLNLLVILTSGAALVLSAVLLGINDIQSHRRSMVKDLTTLARIIGYNSMAALEFGDESGATSTLAALEARQSILAAALYGKEGKLFVKYQRQSVTGDSIPLELKAEGAYFQDGGLVIFQSIVKEEKVGTIYIKSDMTELYARLKRNSVIAVSILLLASGLVFIASSRFQRAISEPILDLARTARVVSEDKNYSIRAVKRTKDEIGFLIDRFNEMLAQIEKREKELQELNEQLRHSEQRALGATQAKSQFLANMSHELRTPMNAIIGFSEVLLNPEMSVDEAMRQQFLENILNAGRHLLNLINDILDLSKVEAGKMELHPEEFNLVSCLQGVYAVVRPLAQKKQQTLKLTIAPAIGDVYHDAGRFKQVLYNLLSNAVKFTPEGGTVTTSAQLIDGGWLAISVIDTGIGIKPEDQATLFEEFKQIDSGYARQQQGTGLGLALVRRIVRLMGGDVTVQSEAGQGSTFSIQMPIRQFEKTPSAPAVVSQDGKPLVLVVEDDKPSASLLSFHIARSGYRVECATDAEQALEKAKNLQPLAITLDILLPKEDGWHVLKQLKQEVSTSGIPVIVISVVDDPDTARQAGAAAHLTKPIDVNLLLSTLKKVTNKQ